MNKLIPAVIVLVIAIAVIAVMRTDPDVAPGVPLLGVDLDAKTVTIGALNDESGPAAAIGKPFTVGKQMIVEQVNAGNSGLLPAGWKLRLVERDHGYNPQRAVQLYNEIRERILFLATSFGTPNTLPLRPMLERDGVVAFPASLSSQMAEHVYTPPLGASYKLEARRAVDWVRAEAEDPAAIALGVVFQQDDYGQDGLEGVRAAAAHHDLNLVAEQAIAPGQQDFAAVISALQQAGATHVLLATLPSATGPILGTAAQLRYMPVWIGNTASWIDRFFNPEVIPAAVFTRFYWVTGMPFWGEDIPGMDTFLAAYENWGRERHAPDFYILTSYIQGLVQLEALSRAIDSGDLSREGYLAALRSVTAFDGGGMIQPVDLSRFPYVTGSRTRILQPVMDEGTWRVAADFASPEGWQDDSETE